MITKKLPCVPPSHQTPSVEHDRQWTGGTKIPASLIGGPPVPPHSRHMCARDDESGGTNKKEILGAAAARGLVLKPEQLQACEALLRVQDCLAVAATGFGKTIPAFIVTVVARRRGMGMTVAVFPLKALTTDMKRRCDEFGLRAATWNGDVSDKEKMKILEAIQCGALDILLTTVESLKGEELSTTLNNRVFLAWIDESHTATRDRTFRTDWGRCGQIIDRIAPSVRYACSATVERSQQDELVARCGIQQPEIIRLSPDRPNFRYHHASRSIEAIKRILDGHAGQKLLVYVATCKAAERIAAILRSVGYRCESYHGRMSRKLRNEIQSRFMYGETPVIICTDSFALGIDAPDIRAVVTYDPASSVAGWTQQVGRAGRDGMPADIYICSIGSREGWDQRRWLIECGFPNLPDIERVHQYLKRAGMTGVTGSQESVCRSAGIRNERHVAGAIYRWLNRKSLVLDQRDESNRFTYWGRGEFAAVNWLDYHIDHEKALTALDELSALWALPADQIRGAVVAHFEQGVEANESETGSQDAEQ